MGYSPKKLLLQVLFHSFICEKTPLISHQGPFSFRAWDPEIAASDQLSLFIHTPEPFTLHPHDDWCIM